MTSPDRTKRYRVVLLAALVVGTVAVAGLSVFNENLGAINLGRGTLWWFPIVGSFLFLVPGVVVLLRSNWHPVGWLLVNLGFGFLFSFGPDNPPLNDLSAVEQWWLWLTGTSVSAVFWTVWSALILVFPDRLTTRRGWHRHLAWGVLGVDAVCVALTTFRITLVPDMGGVPSPVPFAGVPSDVAGPAGFLPNILVLIAIADFVVRYRRAKDPVRSQYRWVVWAFLFEVAALLVALIVSYVAGENEHRVWLLAILGYLLVPTSFMVAILRYRLYDIDRVVSRTVTYALVALAVALVYALPVVILPRLLGESNDLIVAGATLAAAALFNPIRRRTQRFVDRRFNRARFDAEHQVDLFGERLRSETDLDAIEAHLRKLISETIAPDRSVLWIRD